jgi:hypothetical protein
MQEFQEPVVITGPGRRITIELNGDTSQIRTGPNPGPTQPQPERPGAVPLRDVRLILDGATGNLFLQRPDETRSIHLDGDAGNLFLHRSDGSRGIVLFGGVANSRLGIGTSPEKALHIRAAGADATGQSNARLIIENDRGHRWFLNVWSDTNRFSIGRIGQADDLVIGANGNVGIGTSDPHAQANLHVSSQGDATVDVDSSHPLGSRTRLRSVVSNNRTESQLQFREQLSFVAPLPIDGPPGSSRTLLTLTQGGDLFLHRSDGSRSIHLDGEAGDIALLGADCAEDFDVEASQTLESGTVLVIHDDEKLRQCSDAYDKRVAGVISGAGGHKAGVILNRHESPNGRVPLALTGKVYCKVDAQYSPIEVGDLLTTSPTAGHAMKAIDPLKAIGAVLGKALRSMKEGQGMVPILITLQ